MRSFSTDLNEASRAAAVAAADAVTIKLLSLFVVCSDQAILVIVTTIIVIVLFQVRAYWSFVQT